MRKLCAFACAFALTGCAWLGFGDDSDTVSTSESQAAEISQAPEPEQKATATPEPAVNKQSTKAKKTPKATRGGKSESQIQAELDVMGKKLAAQSARTLMPNKAHPDYKQVGGQWIASYIDVDTNHVSTEMRAGANGQYVGFIRYQERFMECRGATKQAAMSGGNCQQVKTRNLNELIRYDGKEWQD